MNSAALLIALFCGTLGGVALSLVKDPQERALLLRLFFVAFGIRLIFTLLFYATGLVDTLGGADDTGWAVMWERAQTWHNFGPDTLATVYNADVIKTNSGWHFFGTYFYYLLDSPSQMALAFFNCFANSILILVIYKAAREFFSLKACSFVAWVAVWMPGFLTWSALTVKETWVILFEISTFYAIWRLSRQRNPLYSLAFGVLAAGLIVLTLGFRFYAAAFLMVGILMTLMCCWASRPARAAVAGLGLLIVLATSLDTLGIIQLDVASVSQSRVAELNTFRSNISDVSQAGNKSAVSFDFDTSSSTGVAMMLGVGSAYVLFSPFPWQMNSVSQLAALPDVLLWWWLVVVLIVPGIRQCWKHHQALLISITAFVLPLLLFYAFMFGNVGLAYRQRAQLMPFLLVLAAAGYERREQQRKVRERATLTQSLAASPTVIFGLNRSSTPASVNGIGE